MEHTVTVRDLWFKTNRKTGQRARSSRYGVGKRWQVNYTDLEGKRTSEVFDTREEAELFDASVKVKKSDGTLISADKKDVRLEDIWQAWCDALGDVSDSYRGDCESIWRVHIHPTWGRRRIAEIQDHQVTAWVAGLTTTKGVKPGAAPRELGSSQRRKIANMMKSLLQRAVILKIIPANPLEHTQAPRQKKAERRYLTIEEVDALLAAAQTDAVKLMVEVLLKTGLRPGEAKGLKVRDLDRARRRLTIRRDVDDLGRVDETKTRQHRDVPISQLTLLLLERAADGRDSDAWLLPDERGHVWTTARWRPIWENLLVDAGVDRTLKTYELRHTAVSMAIAAGADVYVVQRMVGHTSAATTLNYYGHLWDQGLDQAAEAIERHLEAERARVDAEQARRAEREKAAGVRHLRVVE
ncbi:site-specific recombinase, phage integrase family [Corynebacterium lipophiloflavum DSM 44291]|uniref:Site-specific recombinase, phage integrase family n=1 Tax=Corynebacterium lipophiloflavum (strain ATCC 700352 / DSM 44291 / CCUG 37336 / JCM 10383 / DMMZ 1944) TaxID=525263 RepID=C0XTX9_CORLD|nr:site-specific recombinase, phage integrase family [Corynebacterium lipophiloflavum DSM 44291]